MAKKAFEYENFHYNEELNNWPDFRNGIYDAATQEEHKQHYQDGNKDFFFTPGHMAAWCHGSPGVGLSRITAHRLLGDERYEQDLHNAVKRTKEVTVDFSAPRESYTLCHGAGGNAMLFTEAGLYLNNSDYMELAEQIAVKGATKRAEGMPYSSGFAYAGADEDTSLFMGNAGVGYFYLHVLEPEKVPSILKPTLDATSGA